MMQQRTNSSTFFMLLSTLTVSLVFVSPSPVIFALRTLPSASTTVTYNSNRRFLMGVPRGGSNETKQRNDSDDEQEVVVEEEEEETSIDSSSSSSYENDETVINDGNENIELEEEEEEEVIDTDTTTEPMLLSDDENYDDVDDVVVEVEDSVNVLESSNSNDDEDEEVVAFPAEIPSDEVRSFHTTDGELADDESVTTDNDDDDNDDTVGNGISRARADDPTQVNVEPEEEIDAMTAFGSTTTITATAVASTIIDPGLKSILMNELRYTKHDVRRMRPDIAQSVVDHKLVRPYEGMPKNWYLDHHSYDNDKKWNHRRAMLVRTIAVGCLLSVSYHEITTPTGWIEELWENITHTVPKSISAFFVGSFQAITNHKSTTTNKTPKPKTTTKIPGKVASSSSSVGHETVVDATADDEDANNNDDLPTQNDNIDDDDDDERTTTNNNNNNNNKAYSIKPGTKEFTNYNTVDVTWLDKFLTAIENSVKGFFNIKI